MGRKKKPEQRFLCRLTADQWHEVHQWAPNGSMVEEPVGFLVSGIYESPNAQRWIVQRVRTTDGTLYRYWTLEAVFDLPDLNEDERLDLLEMTDQLIAEATSLRQQAQDLLRQAEECETAASEFASQALIVGV